MSECENRCNNITPVIASAQAYDRWAGSTPTTGYANYWPEDGAVVVGPIDSKPPPHDPQPTDASRAIADVIERLIRRLAGVGGR